MQLKVSMLRALLSLGAMAMVGVGCDLPDPDLRPMGPGGPGPGPGGGPDEEPDAGPIPEPAELDELPSPTLPAQPLDYGHELPAHFDTAFVAGSDNTPANNQISDAGATLGRVLFWDRRLSQNGAVSCGSCHDPGFAFADGNELSRGFEGGLTGRNSMSLVNLRYYNRGAMFWDERADTLEDQVLMSIQDATEMGLSLEELVERVEDEDFYVPLFVDAFGDEEVSSERIAAALAQFVRSIVAYDSPWDVGVAAVNGDIALDFPNYTAQENLGKELFFGRARCGSCHMDQNPLTPGPGGGGNNVALMFVDEPVHNGLPSDGDAGFGAVTGSAQDEGKFKSPSLRNVAQTAPYMHDGRFDSLAQVVNFYNNGVQDHPNLDPRMRDPQTGQPQRLNLDPQERAALVAFMQTLTDESLEVDARWSDPF